MIDSYEFMVPLGGLTGILCLRGIGAAVLWYNRNWKGCLYLAKSAL